MATQSVIPGVSGLPLSERLLLRTHELAQADRITTRLVDRLSFSTQAPVAGIKIHLTGVALDRLRVFGVRHIIPAAVRSAPLRSHHVIVPLQGRMRARSGSDSVNVGPGSAIVYPAGACLEVEWLDPSVALVVTIGREDFDRARAAGTGMGLSGRSAPATFALTAGPGRSFANLLGCLCSECNAGGSAGIVRGLEDLVLKAMIELARPWTLEGKRAASTARRERGLQRALDYLRANPRRHPGIGELARVACLSRRSLETAFAEHLGVGPRAWVTRERLDAARAELLDGTSDLISCVAARWGFDDAERFTRQYRRAFAEPPSATRVRARRARSAP